jgi:ribosomal protein L37AE/L43A
MQLDHCQHTDLPGGSGRFADRRGARARRSEDRIEAVPVDKGICFFIANPNIQIGVGAVER